jgi:hypothetical protein
MFIKGAFVGENFERYQNARYNNKKIHSCLSVTKMVKRKRHHITLQEYCLSCQAECRQDG